MVVPALAPMTLDEFFVWEERQPKKHEFSQGRIVAMAGAAPNHVLITPNLNGLMYAALRGKPCRYQDADTKLRVEATGEGFYPDGMVACPPNFVSSSQGIIDNPMVIFEVLSPGTSHRDLGVKMLAYLAIPSLHEYVVIMSEAPVVTVHARREGEWITRAVIGLDATTILSSLGIELPHAELYEGVQFEPMPIIERE